MLQGPYPSESPSFISSKNIFIEETLCSRFVILLRDCNAFKIEQRIRRTPPPTICLLSELETKAIDQEGNERLSHIPGYDVGIDVCRIMVIESTDTFMFGFLF